MHHELHRVSSRETRLRTLHRSNSDGRMSFKWVLWTQSGCEINEMKNEQGQWTSVVGSDNIMPTRGQHLPDWPVLTVKSTELRRGRKFISHSRISFVVTIYATSWNRVHGKLIVALLVKKLPVFYGLQRFITVFTIARRWSLSWTS